MQYFILSKCVTISINHLKQEAPLETLILYLKENTTLQHYEDVLSRKVIAVYSGNHTKSINTQCEQNTELLVVTQVVHTVTTFF